MSKEERIKAAVSIVTERMARDDEDFSAEVAHLCYAPILGALTDGGALRLRESAENDIFEFWHEKVEAYLEQEQ